MSITASIWRLGVIGALAVSISGCGGGDVYYDAPILEAVGIDLNKKDEDQNVPVRSGIVLPPSTDKLPKPGERTAASEQNWPQDAEQVKARKEQQEAAAREEYCREGKWTKGNIDEFEKNTYREERCPSKLAEGISKALGGGPASDNY